jgi:phosphate transport system substrate-binding protein
MIAHRLCEISSNSTFNDVALRMIDMSNQKPKRNVTRTVIAAVIIVAIIVGAFAYQNLYTQTSTTTQSTMYTQPQTSATTESTMYTQAQAVSLLGAGATFPAPLIQKWTVEYNKLYPSVTINYNPIGSGGGIQQITAKTVDFGGSDAPLSDAQLANYTDLVMMPETLGGVAITYNLESYGISNDTVIKFTGDILAGIYMGRITKWNDAAILAVNPGLNLPNAPITAVHRSDGSGTTYAFTDYLANVNPVWKSTVGTSTSVKWPVDKLAIGVGAKGNAGVAGTVANSPGSIGYVDVIYAVSSHLGVGEVENAAGNFIAPTLQTILYAAGNATGTPNPKDLRLHIVNAQGPQSYPICTYTYLMFYTEMSINPSMTKDKAQTLAKFLWWAIHDGQKYAPALIYVPLPANIVVADEKLLLTLTFNGQQLITA